jgi:transcriptional regulator with XRE-family HTH domain
MKAVQCRMARAALRIGVRELAETACVSTSTISKLERGESLMSRTAEAVKQSWRQSSRAPFRGDEPS